ncbi:MAG: lytic transglycosylase domain-containing protein [Terriglobia bacterium]
MLRSLIAGLTVTAALLLPATSARAEIISYIDENGRRVFVNEEKPSRTLPAQSSAPERQGVARRRIQQASIGPYIEQVATEHRLDPRLVHAIIEVESSWDSWAVSRKGAVGLMQLLPATGRRFGARNLLDPKTNIAAGIRYLRFLLDRFQNNLALALAAYNAGENTVSEFGGIPPYRETRAYVRRVSALYHTGGRMAAATSARAGRIYQEVDENGRIVFRNF